MGREDTAARLRWVSCSSLLLPTAATVTATAVMSSALTPGQEAFYGRPIITATRETVELEADEILRDADKVDVAFLVVGDPLG